MLNAGSSALAENATNMLFAHEIGHYLGLPHVWDDVAAWGIRDPQTGALANASMFWDQVYRRTTNSVYHFKGRADAATHLPNLFVVHGREDGSDGWRCPSGDAGKPCPSSVSSGALAFRLYDAQGNGRVYHSGDRMLQGLALRQPNGNFTFNVMAYNYAPNNAANIQQQTPALSLSQIEQIRRVLTFDIATDITAANGSTIMGQRPLLR